MKKHLLSLSLFLLCVGFSATGFAAPEQSGGFTGNTVSGGGYTGTTVSNVTVAQAKQMPDDTYVTLRGKITQHLRKDKYLFSDATGDIVIEIDAHDWRGVTVAPADTVEIQGEVDKDRDSIEIDVDLIRKI